MPAEVRVIVSRATTGDRWNLDEVMKIFEQEIDARERASLLNISDSSRRMHTRTPTAAALIANDSTSTTANVNCAYCGQAHLSASCTTISDVPTQKETLRKAGRCYVCLKKYHLSKDCHSHIRSEVSWTTSCHHLPSPDSTRPKHICVIWIFPWTVR